MKLLIFMLSMAVYSNASLLKLSQTLWKRLLDGGIDNVGMLDPLHIPVIKVDQSDHNTSYRVILRNVEIVGLNESRVERIHLASGILRSNFNEEETADVSHTNSKDFETIRYRFHTMVENNQQKNGEENDKANNKFTSSFSSTHDNINDNRHSNLQEQNLKDCENGQGQHFSINMGSTRESIPGIKLIHAQEIIEDNKREFNDKKDDVECLNDCRRIQDSRGRLQVEERQYNSEENSHESLYENNNPGVYFDSEFRIHTGSRNVDKSSISSHQMEDRISVHMKDNNSYLRKSDSNINGHNNATGSIGINMKESRAPVHRDRAVVNNNRLLGQLKTQFYYRNPENLSDNIAPQNYSQNSKSIVETLSYRNKNVQFERNPQQPLNSELLSRSQRTNSPGFIDIVYADEKPSMESKHFENDKVNFEAPDVKVYGLNKLLKDLQVSGRYIVHNFTKGEALTKRNKLDRVTEESKSIKDLLRYAKNHTEQHGYFEKGMELIYHYGTENQTNYHLPRAKRAHTVNLNEDDVMHIILRIYVPVLQVKANYVFTGVAGNKTERGHGLLASSFMDLIGDFTIELKKTGADIVVRASRAKLVAKNRNVTLKGIENVGLVDDILVHGSEAAEAVAAIIVDDLATKAFSGKITDATVYKIYKDSRIEA